MQLVQAIALKPARFVTTKFGERVVLDVRLPDGTEGNVWDKGNAATSRLTQYVAGQAFYVDRKPDGRLALVELDQAPAMAPAALPPVAPSAAIPVEAQPLGFQIPATQRQPDRVDLTRAQREAIAADAELFTRIYSHCYAMAKASMPPDAPLEAIQACASSAWISVSRRYGLG